MDSEEEFRSILAMLGNDANLFRNGTDCYCIVHTNAGRYKRNMNELRSLIQGWDIETDPNTLIEGMEDSVREILNAGYRMASVTARLYVMGMMV